MATTRELARAAAPLGYFEPHVFGRRWMRDLERFFGREFPAHRLPDEFEFAWIPEMEVFDKNNRLTVRLDVPGLKKEELKVHVAEGVLTVEGERKVEAEEEKNNWYTRERTYGKFCRRVGLPEGVNPKEVEATFSNGVLEVTAPLHTGVDTSARRVDVKGPEEKVATPA